MQRIGAESAQAVPNEQVNLAMLIRQNRVLGTETGGKQVRFEVFGAFRTVVDGDAVSFKDSKFLTYLKLYLLSDQSYLNSSRSCALWSSPKEGRDTVNNGNLPPKLLQGGRFDFSRITGLSLKYTDKLGIQLVGDWSSDIKEFEAVWASRQRRSDTELERAIELYGQGVDLTTWKKDPTFLACRELVKRRLAELQGHCKDIEAELESRVRSEKAVASIMNEVSRPPDGLSDEEITHQETSGFVERPTEPEAGSTSSTSLSDPLCQISPADLIAAESAPKLSEDDARRSTVEESLSGVMVSPVLDSVSNPPVLSEDSSSDNVAQSKLKAKSIALSPPLQTRRNVTALGVVVTTSLIVLIFAAGYWIALASHQSRTPSDIGGEQLSSGSKGLPPLANKKSVTREEPITRAPQTTVALEDLFLKNLAHITARSSSDEVVIGRQLFSHYIWAESGPEESVPAYKLDTAFSSVTCVVGIPDEDTKWADSDNTVVIFEADGRVLKRLSAKPGNPTPVTLSVKGVRVLAISFHAPVVIAAPKAHR